MSTICVILNILICSLLLHDGYTYHDGKKKSIWVFGDMGHCMGDSLIRNRYCSILCDIVHFLFFIVHWQGTSCTYV